MRKHAFIKHFERGEVRAFYRKNGLLTVDNAKFKKSASTGKYVQIGLTLSPSDEGCVNNCSHASLGCRKACLNTTVRNTWKAAVIARQRRTWYLENDREEFIRTFAREQENARKRAEKAGLTLAVRPETMSDRYLIRDLTPILDDRIQYLDYTADPNKYREWLAGRLPDNYHLTFSRKENNEPVCLDFLAKRGTCTLVVRDEAVRDRVLKEGYRGYPAVDGDLSDRRWEDVGGRWIVLLAKGKAKNDETGFVID
jgi:hypothetical protein